MGTGGFTYRKPAGIAAAVVVSMFTLFAGTPVSVADPFDGDDGGGSSSSGGGDDGGGGGVGVEEPSGGGAQDPSGGGMQEPPDAPGGGMQEPPDAPGGGMQEPADQPGGGMHDPTDAPGGGGTQDDQPSGGGAQEPGTVGGGMMPPTETQASQEDYTTASASQAVETTSTEVSTQEIATYEESVSSTVSMSTLTTELTLSSPVALWNSGWISYDTFYRPVFTNPYRTPLNVLYDYGGQTQVFTVAPLQRATLNVPNAGVYNFTAMTRPASGPATNLSVGSFSGGGYQPAPGQAPPQQPAALNTQKNVLVQVKFDRGTSAPFRVKTLTDLGADPGVKGSTKVLLDGEIPAWGQWSKTDKGEALFVISQTQTLPGINRPAQGPLPGYNIKLAAAEKSTSWIDRNQSTLISVAIGVCVLALAGVGIMLFAKRRQDAP
ncbi:hypothetical protein ACTXG7_25575 [Mycolicibacterium sp. Dal123E01]|uniref:hypothetical protein n=1 Tax=Mycolicibacterium sp. Dal123E01 TaxID=3457578 RepID=UPI00403E9919